jgi:phage shock protein C
VEHVDDAIVPPQLSGEQRLLRRSRTDKVVAGVCGGLGRYLGIDPIILRIAFVVLAFSGGGGVALYIIAWIVIPEEKEGDAVGPASRRPDAGATARLILGGTFIAVGTTLLLNIILPGFGKYLWPLALIALGVGILVQASVRKRDGR